MSLTVLAADALAATDTLALEEFTRPEGAWLVNQAHNQTDEATCENLHEAPYFRMTSVCVCGLCELDLRLRVQRVQHEFGFWPEFT